MRNLILLLVLTAGTSGAVAQPQTPLTLEECIRLAEEQSYQLQSDAYEIAVAENTASIMESRSRPVISGEVAMDNRFLRPYYFNQMWASVHADWALGDVIRKTGKSSLQDVETLKLEKAQHRLDVVSRSTSLYMSILQVDEQTGILGVRIRFLDRHYDVSRAMWQAGLRSEMDMLQTETEIARLKEDSARLTIVRNDLGIELAHLLGMDSLQDLRLAPLKLDSLAAGPVPDILLQDVAKHPVLAAFDSRMNAEQLRYNEITADQVPHIRMGSGYVKDGDPTGDGNYWQIQAGVSVPIYSGNSYRYQKEGTLSAIESLKAQRSMAERELLIHLQQVHEKLVSIRRLMELQQHRLEISGKAVEYAGVNYRAGIASNLEFLTAQQQWTRTELEIGETRLDYAINLIEFYVTNNQVDRIMEIGSGQALNP